MTLSSRIAVMEKGRFEQIGAPREVYEFPTNRFVADFIGNINIFEGTVATVDDGMLVVDSKETDCKLSALTKDSFAAGSNIGIAVRPEKIFISQHEPDNNEDVRVRGVVEDLGYFGNLSLYKIRLGTGKMVQVSAQNRRRSTERFLEWDDEVFISWRLQSAIVLTD